MLSSKLIKNSELKIYKGGPHGLPWTMKDKLNADLLTFVKSVAARSKELVAR